MALQVKDYRWIYDGNKLRTTGTARHSQHASTGMVFEEAEVILHTLSSYSIGASAVPVSAGAKRYEVQVKQPTYIRKFFDGFSELDLRDATGKPLSFEGTRQKILSRDR